MIRFTKKEDNLFTEGVTAKGNNIFFVQNETLGLPHNTTTSSIVIYSSIYFTNEMKEKLKESKIFRIGSFCNEHKQFTIYPLANFDYGKLKELFAEFVETFEL